MDNFEAPEVVMTDTERILQLELAQYQLIDSSLVNIYLHFFHFVKVSLVLFHIACVLASDLRILEMVIWRDVACQI